MNAQPDTGTDQPLFEPFAIGALACTSVSDGYVEVPAALLAAAPADQLKAFLEDCGQPGDVYRNPISCLVVTLPDGRQVVVDSGMGTVAGSQGKVATAGRFGAALEPAGYDPDSISIVLVSHLHPDHFGGLFDDADQPLFANAHYYVSREEVTFWQDAVTDLAGTLMPPPMRGQLIAAARRFLAQAGDRLRLFDAGTSPVAGVQSVALPGHTPGQVGFLFDGQAEQLLYTADCMGHPHISLQRPDWRFAFDTDADLAVASRKQLVRQLLDTGWYNFAPHFPWPSFGRIDDAVALPCGNPAKSERKPYAARASAQHGLQIGKRRRGTYSRSARLQVKRRVDGACSSMTDAIPQQPCSRFKISEVILKTGQLEAMKAWYERLLGVPPFFEHAPAGTAAPGDYGGQTRASDLHMCFYRLSLAYPYTQTIGIFAEPGTAHEASRGQPGLHHVQLATAGIDELCRTFEMLRSAGLHPHRAADHGPMTSFYYRDPDGNNVELTAQNFPTLDAMVAFMASAEFAANPSGRELDPDAFVESWRQRSADPV